MEGDDRLRAEATVCMIALQQIATRLEASAFTQPIAANIRVAITPLVELLRADIGEDEQAAQSGGEGAG